MLSIDRVGEKQQVVGSFLPRMCFVNAAFSNTEV